MRAALCLAVFLGLASAAAASVPSDAATTGSVGSSPITAAGAAGAISARAANAGAPSPAPAAGVTAVTTEVSTDPIVRAALAAEAQLDTRRALELFTAAEKNHPGDAFLLQKIARQHSDLLVDLKTDAEKKSAATAALAFAERAAAAAPRDPVNLLSLAVCHGELALYSDTRTKVAYSRLVKEEAERALALDPNYAWAHHVMGRWHSSVSDLGATARVFVRIFYGGLPGASPTEAVRHLERAVALEPEELEHHLELGFAYLSAGQTAAARAAIARGLAMPSRAKHDEPAKTRARAALAQLNAGGGGK